MESVETAGNRRLSSKEILSHVKSRPGDPYDEGQVHRDLSALANLGAFDMTATRVTTEIGQRGGVNITFEVKELPIIKAIRFEGLKATEESSVRAAFRRDGVRLIEGDFCRPTEVNKATRVLKDWLLVRGWSHTTVESQQEQDAADSVKLTFVVIGQRAFLFRKLSR
ncbi:MAG: POTRA domain-containing protein [Pyrinomonadaceae bacterium]